MNSGEQNLWSVKPNTGLVRVEDWGCPLEVQTTGLAKVIVPIHVRVEGPKTRRKNFQPTHIS